MAKRLKLEDDVEKVLNSFSELVGRAENHSFHVDLSNECFDCELESPIEKIFLIAFKAVGRINGHFHEIGQSVSIDPQKKIDKYRVDFEVALIHWEKSQTIRRAVVECDGHEFHDRSEPERRYEKQRDRYLQSLGYRIFHFTGKEIKDDPVSTVSEVLAFLTGESKKEIYAEVSQHERR